MSSAYTNADPTSLDSLNDFSASKIVFFFQEILFNSAENTSEGL